MLAKKKFAFADIPKNTSIIVISNDYDTIFDPHDIDNVILFTLKPIDPEKFKTYS
jgi:hypothetical protein